VEPPSTRPWLGVGAALGALPAAGGCLCVALVLALLADSDPGAVYQQHRWLGAIVAASASCAYVAMMGWATLRHGGLPAPVLLMALALAGAPFLLPHGLVLPAAALAVAGCAVLATVGLSHPPASPDGTRIAAIALTGTAVLLVVGHTIVVDQAGLANEPRSEVLAIGPARSSPAKPGDKDAAPAPEGKDAAPAPDEGTPSSPARAKDDGSSPAQYEGAASSPARAEDDASSPAPAEDEALSPGAPGGKDAVPAPDPNLAEGPAVAPAPDPGRLTAAARRFVRDYYAALDAHDFATAWAMLSPDVRRAFGGFAVWKRGYAHTGAHNLGRLKIAVAGGAATVALTLRAGNRGACDTVVARRFAVTWRLVRTEAGLRAAAARGRKISGTEPC
jgi:hypothetical protein